MMYLNVFKETEEETNNFLWMFVLVDTKNILRNEIHIYL